MRVKRFKTRKKNYSGLVVILGLIIFFTYLIISYVGNKLTPIVENIVEINVDKTIHNYLYNMFSVELLEKEDLMDIVSIKQNAQGEVISADYRLDLAYKYLSDEMTNVFNRISDLNIKMEYYDYDKDLFFVPLGIINKRNMIITDFGFKIPCKVNFFSDVRMYFKTKVTDYGLNNVLVELYLVVEVKNELLSPSSFYEFSNSYEIIVASKVVMGKIPVYYGNTFEKSSAILSS